MNPQADVSSRSPAHTGKSAPRRRITRAVATLAAAAALMAESMPASALDGCQVLLCLAAPSWRAIPQCVPTITQLFRDLARGKAFPSCAMSGAGNSASHVWASAPSYCPPQYTRVVEGANGPVYTCDYSGAVSVDINGALFTRTWWSLDGGTVTEYSAAAKAQLGSWDSRFDEEFAAWLASQPPATPAPVDTHD